MKLSRLKALIADIEADIAHNAQRADAPANPDPEIVIGRNDREPGYLDIRERPALAFRVFDDESGMYIRGGDYILGTATAQPREGREV